MNDKLWKRVRSAHWVNAALLATIGLYFWRVFATHSLLPKARVFHDTQFYFQVAANGLWSRELWGGGRAPLPCVLFHLCQLDVEKIRHTATLISVLSWALLALAISRSARTLGARLLGPILTVTLALSIEVLQWNEVALSESLSCSLTVLMIAASLMYLARRGLWALLAIATAAAAAFSRDTNAYLVLFIAACAGIAALLRLRRGMRWQTEAAMCLALAGVFVASDASANAGRRWIYPLTNVVVTRVLPEPATLEKFRTLGLPHSRALRPGRPRRAYDSDRSLADFRDWIASQGKRKYLRFLAQNPEYLLGRPELSAMLADGLANYRAVGTTAAEPEFLQILWARDSWRWHVALILLLSCGALLLFAKQSSATLLGLLLALLAYPHALVVWHGDSMEIVRHAFPVALQVRLALLFLIVGLVESFAGQPRGFRKRVPFSH